MERDRARLKEVAHTRIATEHAAVSGSSLRQRRLWPCISIQLTSGPFVSKTEAENLTEAAMVCALAQSLISFRGNNSLLGV